MTVPAQLDYHARAKAARVRMAAGARVVERTTQPARVVIDVAARKQELLAARERREAEAAAEREAKIRAAFRLAVDSFASVDPKAVVSRIKREVAARHGVTVEQIDGLSRHAKVNAARQEAMWTARERTLLSLSKIGVLFNRDHTSVLWGIRQHEARMAGTSISRIKGAAKPSLAATQGGQGA